jgi:hypothetical protein
VRIPPPERFRTDSHGCIVASTENWGADAARLLLPEISTSFLAGLRTGMRTPAQYRVGFDMNIMLVSVTERTREIGIRMAVGSRGSYIRMQFLAESVILCMFGGVVGIVARAGLSVGIENLMNWPTLVSLEAAVISFAFAAGIGIFFGYYPVHKAASLEPIDALRYE